MLIKYMFIKLIFQQELKYFNEEKSSFFSPNKYTRKPR